MCQYFQPTDFGLFFWITRRGDGTLLKQRERDLDIEMTQAVRPPGHRRKNFDDDDEQTIGFKRR